MSLIPTISNSGCCPLAKMRKTVRPIRPNPLIKTVILRSFITRVPLCPERPIDRVCSAIATPKGAENPPTCNCYRYQPKAFCHNPISCKQNALRAASKRHMAIHIFIEQIAKFTRPARVTSLRAEGAQPHVIASLDLNPVLIEFVDRFAFQNIQAMFHHMGLQKRDHPARLKGHDIDVHVMTQIVRLDKTRRAPFSICVRHVIDWRLSIRSDKGLRHLNPLNRLMFLANPVEFCRCTTYIF
mmetsp:Transcript_22106/g.35198  ORF Transcript_22106/g.35198 Transcript_22106/m.35198 type:complete len:241 (-) Transcript_22106:387-1109(-)